MGTDYRYPEAIEALMALNADVNALSKDGTSPLKVARSKT